VPRFPSYPLEWSRISDTCLYQHLGGGQAGALLELFTEVLLADLAPLHFTDLVFTFGTLYPPPPVTTAGEWMASAAN
jgi:hypothetical protein